VNNYNKTDNMDNLFKYAISELSNDAFLCWLISISKNDNLKEKSIEYKVSQTYLRSFCNYEDKIIVNKENGIKRQEGDIDVLVRGRYDNEDFILVIDNKTTSKEGPEQLKKYRDYIFKNNKHIKKKNCHFIYYKTAIQSDINKIKEEGYKIFQLFEIYDLLKSCNAKRSKNQILKNYYDYIKEEAESYLKYLKVNVSGWDEKAFVGFFVYMSNKLKEDKGIKEIGFGYHDNPNKGHWSLWFSHKRKIKNKDGNKIGFQLNLETSNKNSNANWLCRLIVRADGREDGLQWKKSDIEQYIGKIGNPTVKQPGKNIILSQLFQIDKNNKKIKYKSLEKMIMKELEKYNIWQIKEGFK